MIRIPKVGAEGAVELIVGRDRNCTEMELNSAKNRAYLLCSAIYGMYLIDTDAPNHENGFNRM